MSVDHERIKKNTLRQVWFGVFAGTCIAVAAGYFVVMNGPDVVPPPVNDLRTVEFELEEGCQLRIALPGSEAEVRSRPERNSMVTDTIPHDTILDFESVRRDWVQVRAPSGWVSRRDVATVCR